MSKPKPAKNEVIECACGCGRTLLRFHPKFYTERQYIHGHNTDKKSIDSSCSNCGKPIKIMAYLLKRCQSHHCSAECRKLGRRQQFDIECVGCHAIFQVPANRKDKAKYCSKACRLQTESVTRPCAQCGIEVTRARATMRQERIYCSRECQHNYQSEHCRAQNHPLWRNAPKRQMGSNWTRQRRAALRRDNFTCQLCGATDHLEVHHLKPARHFIVPERSNSLDNLQTVCSTCHPAADMLAREMYG